MDTGFEEYHNRQVYQYDLPHKDPYGSQYFHYLRLIWSEQEKRIDYTLRYNTSRPGLWHLAAPQRGCSFQIHLTKFKMKLTILFLLIIGTMQKLNYGEYDDTIQALKVNGNHMLLTFCQDRLFSIVLTREPRILAIEVR